MRICDRCGEERGYFSTSEWTEVTIALPKLDGKERAVSYDLCVDCSLQLRHFIAGYERPQLSS